MENTELFKLELDDNFDFIDKMVDENIILTSEKIGKNNYWALNSIINKKARFYSSIKNLKKIIKEILSWWNLVKEEKEKKTYE